MITHVDELVDKMLVSDFMFDIVLPRLPKRQVTSSHPLFPLVRPVACLRIFRVALRPLVLNTRAPSHRLQPCLVATSLGMIG